MPGVYGGDEINAFVLDPGAANFRGGWAGEDTPRAVFPSHYAWLPDADADVPMPDANVADPAAADPAATANAAASAPPPRRRRFVGDAAVSYWRPHLQIDSPFSPDGIVADNAAFQDLAAHAFHLLSARPEDAPLLLSEPPTNPRDVRAAMAELAFEGLNVPAFYLANRSVLSAFASGRPSALVLDVGASHVSAVPVVDGFVLRKGIHSQPAAGDAVSRALLSGLVADSPAFHGWLDDALVPQFLVRKKAPVDPAKPANATLFDDRLAATAPSFRAFHSLRVLNDMKESICQVFEAPWDPAQAAARPAKMFEFPDGYNDAYSALRFKAPEAIFSPSIYANVPRVLPSRDVPYLPLQDLVLAAINAVDVDSRAAMFSNIVCVGGASLLPGFVDRLSYELSAAAPNQRIKIHSPGNLTERRHSSWLGGSILASLGTFHQLWVSKQEYDEHGSAIVHARCK
ncbi:NuA4 histone acetyltransferase subunit [Malassezia cuniculi]|uniref:NuA4 histone acetyltransferase subunit n=1 Tax=Malassezia cuniculi TaxID=948313 RepID=A0AAF0EW71_9BASI|nr:NuA4 histone acetyltransferase subunit [Malassezia cuniculi]